MPIALHMFGRRTKVPAAVAAGTDGYHRYRLQQQLVPMARTDGPFSSSGGCYWLLLKSFCVLLHALEKFLLVIIYIHLIGKGHDPKITSRLNV